MSWTREYTVEGMACAHCEKTVKDALKKWDEVGEVEVDLASGKVTVHYSSERVDEEKILNSVKDAGYYVQ